jgi:predicted O-methyltransferase YrrM
MSIPTMRPAHSIKEVRDLYEWARQRIDMNLAVEIGTFAGENAVIMSEYFKKVYTIDPWQNGYDQNDLASSIDFNEVEKAFKNRMININNVIHIKKIGEEALNDFENESLDFVYIDGNHQQDAVIKDINSWRLKVKKNGIISGHDLSWRSIQNAIAACSLEIVFRSHESWATINK